MRRRILPSPYTCYIKYKSKLVMPALIAITIKSQSSYRQIPISIIITILASNGLWVDRVDICIVILRNHHFTGSHALMVMILNQSRRIAGNQ